jgi:hypothetical protein
LKQHDDGRQQKIATGSAMVALHYKTNQLGFLGGAPY